MSCENFLTYLSQPEEIKTPLTVQTSPIEPTFLAINDNVSASCISPYLHAQRLQSIQEDKVDNNLEVSRIAHVLSCIAEACIQLDNVAFHSVIEIDDAPPGPVSALVLQCDHH